MQKDLFYGKMEYQISLDGGAVVTSGPVDFDNTWKGLPNGTTIMLRVQNLSTASAAPDASKRMYTKTMWLTIWRWTI